MDAFTVGGVVHPIRSSEGYDSGFDEARGVPDWKLQEEYESEQRGGKRKHDEALDRSRLDTFVRSMGGIKSTSQYAGEVRRLSNRESGSSGLVTSSGLTPDSMREAAAEAGYIPHSWNAGEFLDAVEESVRMRNPKMATKAKAKKRPAVKRRRAAKKRNFTIRAGGKLKIGNPGDGAVIARSGGAKNPRKRKRNSTATRTRTATATEVRSPTSTSTSTDAYTRGNVTVTGGAGAGATHVTIKRNPKKRAAKRKNLTLAAGGRTKITASRKGFSVKGGVRVKANPAYRAFSVKGRRSLIGLPSRAPRGKGRKTLKKATAVRRGEFKASQKQLSALWEQQGGRPRTKANYSNLVIYGTAMLDEKGWKVAGKHYKTGSGTAALGKSKYLDRATGQVYKKVAANPKANGLRKFKRMEKLMVQRTKATSSKRGQDIYPDYYKKTSADLRKRQKREAARKSAANPGRARVHRMEQSARRAKKSGSTTHAAKAQRARTAARKYAARHWEKARVKNAGGVRIVYNRLLGGWYVVSGPHRTPLNGRFGSKAEAQAWLGRKNPAGIFEKFHGRKATKATVLNAPDGTPANLDKLGKLVSIHAAKGTIKPAVTTWLCADSRGKLHLCTSAPRLIDGGRQDFGKVKKVEYSTNKKHLGDKGQTTYYHHFGEENGKRPSLIADGKGGLKFWGGAYRITSAGVEN